MHALGNYILRGRLQAIAVISFLSIFSLLLPALAYLMSGVPVALVSLRRGGLIGIQVITGSLFMTLLLTLLMHITPPVALAFALGIWAPIWCCSMVLRKTESQGLLVLTCGAAGMLFIVLMYAFMGDVPAWWKTWLDAWIESSFTAGRADEYKQIFAAAVPLMNAMMASGIVISLVLTTLIARWWQALLINPGLFKKEFYALRIPRVLCYPTSVGVIILLLNSDLQHSMLRDLLIVMVFLYMFQGVSAIHRIVSWRKLSLAWLVGMYGLLLLLPQMVLIIACIGMADSWLAGGKQFGGKNNS
ncbi:MAG: DUF2232 domain-containing protein [Gammaproteobacteria bacterium]